MSFEFFQPWMGVVIGAAIGVAGLAIGRWREAVARRSFERADAMRTGFVNTVSHELRTPLTSIGGFAATLRTDWERLGPDEVDEFLGIICREVDHLSTLVEDILVVPRLESDSLDLEPEVMDLSDMVDDLVASVFAPGHEKDLLVSVPNGVKVYADPKRVGQIVRNLLSNAAKHGGRQVAVEGQYLGTHYQLVVSDDGAGIPRESRRAIFEEFEKGLGGDTRSGGIGLGLPIAQRLAKQMGGDLWFEPRFPAGSRFFVTFPLSAGAFTTHGMVPHGTRQPEFELQRPMRGIA
jgi:signal transduction histidine kinase